jgi:hypothetical protein
MENLESFLMILENTMKKIRGMNFSDREMNEAFFKYKHHVFNTFMLFEEYHNVLKKKDNSNQPEEAKE